MLCDPRGAAFSLFVKPGWARPYGIEGTGWVNRLLGFLHPSVRRFLLRAIKALQTSPPAALGTMMRKE